MSLYRVQDQLAALSPLASVWSCVSGRTPVRGEQTQEISKQFAHRSGRSFVLCARLAARLGNPEDRP